MAIQSPTAFREQWRSSFGRLLMFLLLWVATAWVGLLDGQPIFLMSDTTNYVRTVDFAVVYFLGDKYATPWTQERTLIGLHRSSNQTVVNTPQEVTPLNAPFEKSVMSGRSIYYGVLIYLGHISGHFWFSVFVQGAGFLFLTYTLMVTCLGLPFLTFAGISVAVLLLTPAAFFISFLTPDIFASLLVLGTVILTVFWDRLTKGYRLAIGAIVAYCTITHISHLLLLICLTLSFGLVSVLDKRQKIFTGAFPKKAAALGAIIAIGFIGELAFAYGVKLTIGAYPMRPPFVMGRLINDGPGFRFLQKNCPTKPYVVCNYLDRLPTDINVFLWSKDPKAGVFSLMDLATRRKLAAEQASFAWDVFKFDPMGVVAGAANNFAREIQNVGLLEFQFTPDEVRGFKSVLPESYYNDFQHAHLIYDLRILMLGKAYAVVYYLSAAILVLCLAFWPHFRTQDGQHIVEHRRWLYVMVLVLSAIIYNAAICGTLSGPFPRYHTRISWLPFFVLCLFVASLRPTLCRPKGISPSTPNDR